MDDRRMTQGSLPFQLILFTKQTESKFHYYSHLLPFMLESKPETIDFPTTNQSEGMPHPQDWSILSFICWHQVYVNQTVLPNHIYELTARTEGFSIKYIPFLVPSLVLSKDDTLRKACIGTISLIQKPVININLYSRSYYQPLFPKGMSQQLNQAIDTIIKQFL